jgi:arginine deiminase
LKAEKIMQTTMRPALLMIAALLCALFSQSVADDSKPVADGARVVSDVAPLRATIVFTPGDQIFKSSELSGGTNRHPFFMTLPRGVQREHQALRDLLRDQNVRVLDAHELLDNAIRNARRAGRLAEWIRQSFPATANEAIRRIDELDADSLLNRRDDHFYHQRAGALDPLFPGVPSMYWARDFAISTPRGIIIGNGQFYRRSLENALARLMFQYAEQLKEFPIVFDAVREGVQLDGGDVIVLDEKTLLVGVGNRSSREAAPKLAQKLGLEVLAVKMPPADKPNGLSRQLLHLDSIFNLVDRNKILALPFFLEKRSSETNPLRAILAGIAAQVDAIKRAQPERDIGKADDLRATIELMPQVGWMTRYEAGTGKATPLDLKLVDYFRERGYQVIYVGGEQGALPLEKYALERVMYELRWQGANVVQLRPGRVIAYEHNLHTNAALRRAGIEVLTFPGELLSINNGGPHCLLMPLVRGETITQPGAVNK